MWCYDSERSEKISQPKPCLLFAYYDRPIRYVELLRNQEHHVPRTQRTARNEEKTMSFGWAVVSLLSNQPARPERTVNAPFFYVFSKCKFRNERNGVVQRPDLGMRRLAEPSWAQVSAGHKRRRFKFCVSHWGFTLFVVVPDGCSRVRRLSVRWCASKRWRPTWRACSQFVRYPVECGTRYNRWALKAFVVLFAHN